MSFTVTTSTPAPTPKPKKPRKPALTNEQVIEHLVASGQWTQSTWVPRNNGEDSKSYGPFHKFWKRTRPSYWGPWNYQWSYMIPVGIYKEYVARYKVQLRRGAQVRVRNNSTRLYERGMAFNVQDTHSWGHLGIGSGKQYQKDRIAKILELEYNVKKHPDNSYYYNRRYDLLAQNLSSKLLIGNRRYASNIIAASDKVQFYNQNNIRVNSAHPNRWGHSKFKTENLIEHTHIKGDGMFGPKKLINGVITQVYVHFLYPKWEKKRESRYEVLFDTGARGIFTSDYLDVVYDTDYEPDEKLMLGCNKFDPDNIACSAFCHHSKVHLTRENCSGSCFKGNVCQPIYDYTELINLTSGRALDCVEEEKD